MWFEARVSLPEYVVYALALSTTTTFAVLNNYPCPYTGKGDSLRFLDIVKSYPYDYSLKPPQE
jgi:hypothetical protein